MEMVALLLSSIQSLSPFSHCLLKTIAREKDPIAIQNKREETETATLP